MAMTMRVTVTWLMYPAHKTLSKLKSDTLYCIGLHVGFRMLWFISKVSMIVLYSMSEDQQHQTLRSQY